MVHVHVPDPSTKFWTRWRIFMKLGMNIMPLYKIFLYNDSYKHGDNAELWSHMWHIQRNWNL
jgi:hypothetical protein